MPNPLMQWSVLAAIAAGGLVAGGHVWVGQAKARDLAAVPGGRSEAARPAPVERPQATARLEGLAQASREATIKRRAEPQLSSVVIDGRGHGLFTGTAQPRADVQIRSDQGVLARGLADRSGNFMVRSAAPLRAGDVRLAPVMEALPGQGLIAGDGLRLAVPSRAPSADGEFVPVGVPAPGFELAQNEAGDAATRRRAEELGRAATERFDELMPQITVKPVAKPDGPRIAQSQQPLPSQGDGVLAPFFDWLERSSRNYDGEVVRRLRDGAAPGPGAPPKSDPPVVAKPLPPLPAPSGERVAQQGQPPARTEPKAAPAKPGDDGSIFTPLTDWMRRANETYQGTVVKKLSEPDATGTAAIEAKRKADEAARAEAALRKAEQDRREAEARALADAKAQAEAARKAAAEKKVAEDPTAAQRKAAEDKRIADEKRAQDEVERRAADERRLAEAKRLADLKAEDDRRKLDEAARKGAEDKRIADERRLAEAKRLAELQSAEDRRKAEEARKGAEDKRIADERRLAEAKRLAELQSAEDRRKAEEARKAAEDKRIADERRLAEAKRQAELKADEDRRKAEEARKAGEDKRLAEQQAIVERAQQEARRTKELTDQLAAETARATEAARQAELARLAQLKAAEEAKRAADGTTDAARRQLAEQQAADARRRSDQADREADAARRQAEARRAAEARALDETRRAQAAARDAEAARLAAAKAGTVAERQAADRRLTEEARIAEEARRRVEAAIRAPAPRIVADPAPKAPRVAVAPTPKDTAEPGKPKSDPARTKAEPTKPKSSEPRLAGRRAPSRPFEEGSALGGPKLAHAPTKALDKLCRLKAGARVRPPATYIVREGDTLWQIAATHYDRGIRYRRIVDANSDRIDDPDMIYPCQRIKLPRK